MNPEFALSEDNALSRAARLFTRGGREEWEQGALARIYRNAHQELSHRPSFEPISSSHATEYPQSETTSRIANGRAVWLNSENGHTVTINGKSLLPGMTFTVDRGIGADDGRYLATIETQRRVHLPRQAIIWRLDHAMRNISEPLSTDR